jgi:hypothetical protein
MTEIGSIYGTDVDGSNTLVIDFSNVDINGNLKVNGGLAFGNSYGVSGEVLTSQGPTVQPIWSPPIIAPTIYGFLATRTSPAWPARPTVESPNTIQMDDVTTTTQLKRYSLPVANYNTTNSTYTIPKTGYYLVGWNLFVQAPLNNTWDQATMIQLMSSREGQILIGGLNGSENETRHAVLYLEKDDIIRLRFQASYSNAQLQYAGGHYSCWYAFKVN